MWSLLSREGGGSRWDRVQREFTQFRLKHLRKDKFLATHFTVCHLQESALKGNMSPKKAHTPHRKISQPEKPKKQTKSLAFVSSDLLLWRWLKSCTGLQLGLDLPSTIYFSSFKKAGICIEGIRLGQFRRYLLKIESQETKTKGRPREI